jgi:hypothetical protein
MSGKIAGDRNEDVSPWVSTGARSPGRACSLSRYQLHWQAGELPQAITELALRLADDVDALNTRGECCHEHLGFEARQHLADAQMNTGAEGNVTGGPAVDVEALGFVPPARIAVSGSQEQ